MKKVNFTLEQINEVLNVAVDVKNGDVNTSIQNAKKETDRSVGSGVERNYVISGDELNEEDIDKANDIFTQCINKYFEGNNIQSDPDLIMDELSSIYSEMTNGESLFDDEFAYKNMYRSLKSKLNSLKSLKNEYKVYTKKQLEEARLYNLKKKCTAYSKAELIEMFQKNRLNELDAKTYMSAADKSLKQGQIQRSTDFAEYGNQVFQKERGNSIGGGAETKSTFKVIPQGLELDIYYPSKGKHIEYEYNINTDEIFVPFKDEVIEPGDERLRIVDRKFIMDIMSYFNKFKKDSKYNNKNLWIK